MNRIRKTIIETNLNNNIAILLSFAPAQKIIWMLKANAYGHELIPISKFLLNKNQRLFGLYELSEAIVLDNLYEGIEIYILDSLTESEWESLSIKDSFRNKVIICLNKTEDLDKAEKLKNNTNIEFHVFVETGFNWYGVDDIKNFCNEAKSKGIDIKGICSHFSCSDKPTALQTINQLRVFETNVQIAKTYFPNIKTHLGNSNALINSLTPNCDYYRIGRALYGDMKNCKDLKQIIKVEADILQIKEIKKGQEISYCSTFIADRDMKIAVITAGYKDGINRKLSNNGNFLIKNTLCPIVGAIAMNITIVDVSNIDLTIQDIALFTDDYEGVQISDIARKVETIDYEIMTNLNLIKY